MADPYEDVPRAEMLAGAEQSELISYTVGVWSTTEPWRAIVATTSGVIRCRLANDLADRDLPLAAGIPTAYRVVRIAETGTTATGLYRLR